MEFIKARNTSERECRETLRKLRKSLLTTPLDATLRPKIWKILLGLVRVSAAEYSKFIQMGPCSLSDKIDNDAFRTLATDTSFGSRVSNAAIKRTLNAFVWKYHDKPASRFSNLKFTYVQGMNVLVAPLLYVMPELDAFYAFSHFIQNACPLYVQPALEGVHCGCELVEKCLVEIDPELAHFMKSNSLSATVYAFPLVMTFSACLQPLDEVLKLWDFFFAYGAHHNILCIIAILTTLKSELIASDANLPDLNASGLVQKTLEYIQILPDDLYDVLVRHLYDPSVYEQIMSQ